MDTWTENLPKWERMLCDQQVGEYYLIGYYRPENQQYCGFRVFRRKQWVAIITLDEIKETPAGFTADVVARLVNYQGRPQPGAPYKSWGRFEPYYDLEMAVGSIHEALAPHRRLIEFLPKEIRRFNLKWGVPHTEYTMGRELPRGTTSGQFAHALQELVDAGTIVRYIDENNVAGYHMPEFDRRYYYRISYIRGYRRHKCPTCKHVHREPVIRHVTRSFDGPLLKFDTHVHVGGQYRPVFSVYDFQSKRSYLYPS